VRPLLDLVKMYKSEVLSFIKCYCPKSGEVCFGPFDNGEIAVWYAIGGTSRP
jgi:hypothetical protein